MPGTPGAGSDISGNFIPGPPGVEGEKGEDGEPGPKGEPGK